MICSIANKRRLRVCIFSHLVLAIFMVAKLVPDILDKLDVFILEVEEIEVPTVCTPRLVVLSSTQPFITLPRYVSLPMRLHVQFHFLITFTREKYFSLKLKFHLTLH